MGISAEKIADIDYHQRNTLRSLSSASGISKSSLHRLVNGKKVSLIFHFVVFLPMFPLSSPLNTGSIG